MKSLNKRTIIFLLTFILAILALSSCNKEYPSEPVREISLVITSSKAFDANVVLVSDISGTLDYSLENMLKFGQNLYGQEFEIFIDSETESFKITAIDVRTREIVNSEIVSIHIIA